MGLEVSTTIQGLNTGFPTSGDPRSEGDDHIRLIKQVLKASFPGAAGTGFSTPIVAKESDLNAAFTAGVKTVFHQAAAPLGWVQDVTATYANRMLRVVNSVGGGVGGTHNPVFNSVVPQHAHAQQGTFGTGSMSANAIHAHNVPQLFTWNGTGGGTVSDAVRQIGTSPSANTNIDHIHFLTISGNTSDVSQVLGSTSAVGIFQPMYADLILCTKQ